MAGLFSRFMRNKNGNFAMMFAFAAPALMASVALGVDITTTLTAKTELQDANDAAVLLAARYFKENRKQPSMALIQKFLDGNSDHVMNAKKLTFNAARSEYTLESSSTIKTMLMGYFGHYTEDYEVVSQSNLGFGETLEFTLALDTTGSMAFDGKMDGLKVAANNFIDAMFDAKDRGAEIRGGIVPFAQYVNVGKSQKAQHWLDVPKDIDTRVTKKECNMVAPVTGTTNCREVCYPASTVDYPAVPGACSTNDGVTTCLPDKPAYSVNYSASCNTMCDPIYGPEEKICENVTTGEFITWEGYVGSRAYPLNVQDSSPKKKIPGLLSVTGSAEIQPLTHNRKLLVDKINSLVPDGETYMPEGVMWGTRVLTEQAPFSEAKATGKGGLSVRRVLVLMTDGMNTLSPDGEFHIKNNDSTQADLYTAEACNEAKAQKLEVFTISFGNAVPNSAKVLLAACASSPANFYSAKSSADLKQAFEDIAAQMLNVRLSQ
jgi:Flp pilus assembly protein TadG